MYHIVYLTTNLINHKIYVGVHSTWNINDNYIGSGNAIKDAIKKYGKENFQKQILYYCLEMTDAYELEKIIVDDNFIKRKNVYNSSLGGQGVYDHYKIRNKNLSDDHKRKISEGNKNKKHGTGSVEPMALANRGKKQSEDHIEKRISKIRGIERSDETKEKIREKRKLQVFSEETKIKMSEIRKGEKNHFYGKTHSDETKQKLSELAKKRDLSYLTEAARKANTGKQVSKETREKISNANKGKIVSEETKEKIKEKRKLQVFSEESNQKMSESGKGRPKSEEWKENQKGKIWMTNGIETIQTKDQEKINELLNKGWVKGRKIRVLI